MRDFFFEKEITRFGILLLGLWIATGYLLEPGILQFSIFALIAFVSLWWELNYDWLAHEFPPEETYHPNKESL